jgi:tetratricopeptide (TPR) repeat protein
MCLMAKALLARGRTRFDRVLALAGLCVALTLSAPASARADSKEFQRVIGDAVALFEAGRFEAARARFAEAHALAPSARTLRALGMVEFELHHYADSVSYLEQALAARVKPLDEALRREAEEVLVRAQKECARLRLAISPAGASVRVDGTARFDSRADPSAATGVDQVLTLMPGEHLLEASAPGRKSERLDLALRAGEERTVSLALAPLVQAEAAPARKGSEPGLIANPWLWSGVGVAAAALITGLAVGLSGGGARTARTYGGDTGAVLSGP